MSKIIAKGFITHTRYFLKVTQMFMLVLYRYRHGHYTKYKSKWSNVMNDEINMDIVTKAFKYAKLFSPSVYRYYN